MMKKRNFMWKKVCVLALGLLIVFGLCACGAEKKPVMKSQTIKRYQYRQVYETQKFEYDEKGRIVSFVWKNGNEELYAYEIEWEDTKDGAVGTQFGEDGEELGYIEVEYDKDGNMISSKAYSRDGVLTEEIECKWEEGKKVKETSSVYSDGEEYHNNIVKYDEYGNLVSQKTTMRGEEFMSVKYEYEYDKDGLVEECVLKDKLSGEEIEIEFEYDKEGNLEKIRTGDYAVTKYKYDENEVEQKNYYEGELQQEIIVEYYE